jgi:BASS family bile acid:Na+ symporter
MLRRDGMHENFLTVIRYGLILSLFVMKFGQGLEIAPRDLRFFREQRRLMLRSVLVVTLLVPLATLVVVGVLRPDLPTTVALAILAACPAAPMAIGNVARARGTVPYAASLQLAVATLAVVVTPLLLIVLGQVLGFRADLRPRSVAWQVATAQVIPIGLGVLIRAKSPRAAGWGRRLARVATLILLVLLAVVVAAMREAFLELGAREYAAIALTALAALALGHFLAPHDLGMQHALAVETALRNPGLALLVATASFPDAKPLPVLLPCVLVAFVATGLYGAVHGRRRAVEA